MRQIAVAGIAPGNCLTASRLGPAGERYLSFPVDDDKLPEAVGMGAISGRMR